MSANPDIELDADIRAAFEALEATIPSGYFDEFESRLQARLEDEVMTETADENTALNTADTTKSAQSDPSELSGIRALAAKTKEHVSQRLTPLDAPEEPLISSAALALKTISLPEPGKDFKVFASGDAASTAVAARDDEGGLPTWIWAAMSAVLAAAIVFFLVRGDTRNGADQVAVNERPNPAALGQSGTNGPAVTTEQPGNTAGLPSTGTGSSDPMHSVGGSPKSEGEGSSLGGAVAGGMTPGSTDSMAAIGEDAADSSSRQSASVKDTKGTKAKATAGASGKRSAATSDANDDKTSAATKEDTPPPSKKADKKKKPDTLESLLAEASDGDKKDDTDKSETKTVESPKPSRSSLNSNDVKTAMNAIKGKTKACSDKYQEYGMVSVKFGVDPSGAVTSATATGKFKGTDTGKCVAEAVNNAKFPAYNGAPMTFSYAFLLSQ